MKSPTVSVIMATYNHADFVEKSIQSVLMQQGVDFEFLIADDGSFDNTIDVFGYVRFIDKHDIPIPKTTLPFGRVFDQENNRRGNGSGIFLIVEIVFVIRQCLSEKNATTHLVCMITVCDNCLTLICGCIWLCIIPSTFRIVS